QRESQAGVAGDGSADLTTAERQVGGEHLTRCGASRRNPEYRIAETKRAGPGPECHPDRAVAPVHREDLPAARVVEPENRGERAASGGVPHKRGSETPGGCHAGRSG